jgi:hypothetical protein
MLLHKRNWYLNTDLSKPAAQSPYTGGEVGEVESTAVFKQQETQILCS